MSEVTLRNTREHSHDDIARAQELYAQSGDPVYVALAIGHEPAQPPVWAMEAAIALARSASIASAIGNTRDKRGYDLDAMMIAYFQRYDEAWDAGILNNEEYEPPALGVVIKQVLAARGCFCGSPEYESQYKLLASAWRLEAGSLEIERSGVPLSPRQHRNAMEWEDGHLHQPLDIQRAI